MEERHSNRQKVRTRGKHESYAVGRLNKSAAIERPEGNEREKDTKRRKKHCETERNRFATSDRDNERERK